MKKKLLFLSTVLLCTALVVGGTLSYYTAENTAHNVITTGGVKIQVIQQMRDGDTLIDFPEEGFSGVMPGMSVSNVVKVRNVGVADAWVRAKVEITIKGADSEPLPLVIGQDTPVLVYMVKEGWLDGGDGYYYFSSPLAPDELTGELFDEIQFDLNMGNEYQGCTANIILAAQAVQVDNNPIPGGGDVTDVAGWPA